MKRTTIFIDDEVESEIKALAQRNKRPVAAEVREALSRHVAAAAGGKKASLSIVAIGRSGRRDTAERHEEILSRRLSGRRRSARH
jgi:hypothetical protein